MHFLRKMRRRDEKPVSQLWRRTGEETEKKLAAAEQTDAHSVKFLNPTIDKLSPEVYRSGRPMQLPLEVPPPPCIRLALNNIHLLAAPLFSWLR
jgi:hypothetical protein